MYQHELFWRAAILLWIWIFFVFIHWQLTLKKVDEVITETNAILGPDYTSLAFAIVVLYIVLIHPYFNAQDRIIRWEFIVAYCNVIFTPFTKIQFRHYFVATVTSSLQRSMADLGMICLYFGNGYWLKSDIVLTEDHKFNTEYVHMVNILPLWWRFSQCGRKYYNTGNKKQIVNMIKYTVKIWPVLLVWYNANRYMNLQHEEFEKKKISYWHYFAARMIDSCYSLIWDFYISWGLFASFDKDSWCLRKQRRFANSTYWYCMAWNTFCRFWWFIISIRKFQFSQPSNFYLDDIEMMVFINMMMSIGRRSVWTVLRCENEIFNNYEKFRDILMIPPIPEDQPDAD